MGFFRRATPMEASHLEKLDRELRAMKEALDHQRASTSELNQRLATPLDEAPTPAQGIESLAARIDEVHTKHAELDAKLAELSARVTSVSTELTNQITELGHDIDALGQVSESAGGAVDEAVLGEIRDGQVRLASEQARYQIAFRDDLAKLAEALRRPPTD